MVNAQSTSTFAVYCQKIYGGDIIMEKNKKVKVFIDNKSYTLSGIESEDYINSIAGYINAKIDEIRKNIPNLSKSDSLFSLLISINIADELFKLHRENQETRKDFQKMRLKLNDLIQKFTIVSKEKEDLTEKYKALAEQLNALNAKEPDSVVSEETVKLKQAAAKLAADNKSLTGQLKALREQLDKHASSRSEQQLAAENKVLTEQVKSLKEQLNKRVSSQDDQRLISENSQLRHELNESSQKILSLEELLGDKEQELNSSRSYLNSINALNETLYNYKSENASLKSKLSSIQKENANLKSKTNSLQKNNSDLKKENSDLKKENSTLVKQNTTFATEFSSLKKENDELHDTNETLSEFLNSLQDKMTKAEDENSTLSNKLTTLKAEKDAVSSELDSLKSEFQEYIDTFGR